MAEILSKNGQIIFVDTAPFIYLFEKHKVYGQPVSRFFDQAAEKKCFIHTSFITYMEICVQPLRLGRRDIADRYEQYFRHNPQLTFHSSLSFKTAQSALELQARYTLRTPDALQIAIAAEHSAAIILTNDKKWQRLANIFVLPVDGLL